MNFIQLVLMVRARSVFERALDIDHRNIPMWLQYAEMEMRYLVHSGFLCFSFI